MISRSPRALAGVALVLGTALVTSLWGVELRDLSSTELEEFTGSGPMGILLRSITPTDNDWGAHMPLSHLLRWVLVELFGESRPLAWRLHVATASCAAAVLGWHLLARSGRQGWAVAAGLLVAVHPVVSFHAHESSNYGFGALMGGLLLLALLRWEEDRPGAAAGLTAAVLLGMSNDLFFAFPALAALGWTGWRAATERAVKARFLAAWGAVAAIAAAPVVWFLVHMARLPTERIIGPHADPIPDESRSVLAAAWGVSQRFADGYVGGYLDGGGTFSPWLDGPALLLVALIGVAFLRRPGTPAIAATAAWLSLVPFGIVLMARLGFGFVTGREFTTEPRIFSALTIPLIIGWTLLCARLGRRGGALAWVALLTALSIPTARQLATISDRDTRAAQRITELAGPDDAILVSRQVRWRLPDEVAARALDCLDRSAPLPSRIWMAVERDAEEPQTAWDCEGEVVARPGDGWVLRLVERLVPPDYERQSASFLPELVLSMIEQGESPGGERSLQVTVSRPAPWVGALLISADSFPERDGRPVFDVGADGVRVPLLPRGGELAAVVPALTVGHWVRLAVRPADPPESSMLGLLLPLSQPLRDLDAVPVLSDPLLPQRIELTALASPALRVGERILRSSLALFLLVGVLIRLRRD